MQGGQLCLVVYTNIKEPKDGFPMYFSRMLSMEQVQNRISQQMGFQVKQLYDIQGRQITNIQRIANQSPIFASKGEKFMVQSVVHIKNNQEIALDLSLIGAAAVGKSSLIDRYLNDEFKDYYDPTIAETYSKNAKWDNSDVKMNILDTAGMEDYRALSDNWIDGKDAVILVCSVEIHTSLEHLRSEYDNIKARFYDNPNFPTVVICLNKVDMDRQISFEEAKTFADELGLPLFETSAKTNVGIQETFEYILSQVVSRKRPAFVASKSQCCCSIF